jgi:uncharacterized repeat protein (TIGR04076 family)
MIDERIWSIMQKRLGYSDEEQKLFRNNLRNEQVLLKGSELSKTLFVIEIIDANGCNSKHKKGDKIYLDGYGNLIKENNPEKLCIFMIGQTQSLIFAAQELIYAGIDPNEMKFNAVGCGDVGIKCGGWGKVTVKLSAVKQ